ncbi:MAG: Uma2 family endonuclease [Anaerolineae bacterium]|nr:Uma2 family endonuclease [Anaerolineae bacterium]
MAELIVEEGLAVEAPPERMTVEEFWAQYAGKRYELVEGVPREMTPTGLEHGFSSSKVGRFLDAYASEHDLGAVFGAKTAFRLESGLVRAADVAFITKERLTSIADFSKYGPFAPDLAVEVVSPHDRAGDIHRKVNEYLEAGTRLVWVVYPESRCVVVHEPDGTAHTLKAGDALGGGEVLPGLSIAVKDLFLA